MPTNTFHPYDLIARYYRKTDRTGFQTFLHFRRMAADHRRAFGASLIRAGFPYHTVAFMEKCSK